MSCNRRLQARIPSLVAGELDPARSWLLRRHIVTCPSCRAQTERTQNLISGLTALATAPTTDALEARVFDRLAYPAEITSSFAEEGCIRQASQASQPRLTALTAVWAVSRRSLIVLSALLVLTVIGAVATDFASQWFNRAPVLDLGDLTKIQTACTDPSGRTWYLSGDFPGMVLLESKGKGFGCWRAVQIGQPRLVNPDRAVVHVVLNGHLYTLQRMGRHDIRDDAGRLLGTVTLTGDDPDEFLHKKLVANKKRVDDRRKRDQNRRPVGLEPPKIPETGPASLVTESATGAAGYDRNLGLRWALRGGGTLRITMPVRKDPVVLVRTSPITPATPGAVSPKPLLQTAAGQVDPALIIILKGKTIWANHYGTLVWEDARNHTRLLAEIMPPADSTVRQFAR